MKIGNHLRLSHIVVCFLDENGNAGVADDAKVDKEVFTSQINIFIKGFSEFLKRDL